MFSLGDQVNDYNHLYTQQKEYNAFFNPSADTDYLQTHLLAAFSGNHDFQMGKYCSFHYNQPNLSALVVLIQIYTYNMPYYQVMNSNSIATEIIQALTGSMAVILTVPMVSFLSARLLPALGKASQKEPDQPSAVSNE